MSEDDEMIKHTRNFHKEIRIYLNFCMLMKRKKKKRKKNKSSKSKYYYR